MSISMQVIPLPLSLSKQKPLVVWQVRPKIYTGCLKMSGRGCYLLEVAVMIMYVGWVCGKKFKLSPFPRPPHTLFSSCSLKSTLVQNHHFPALKMCRTSSSVGPDKEVSFTALAWLALAMSWASSSIFPFLVSRAG